MSKTLSTYIKKQINAQGTNDPSTIVQLDLSGYKFSQIDPASKQYLEKFTKLEQLILCECDIKSLNNLPQLKNLKVLDLSTNSLSDEQINKIGIYKSLNTLSIADNDIKKLETIKKLAPMLKKLETFECADNDVEKLPGYFKQVFGMFGNLQALDNKDKEGNEIDMGDSLDDEDEEEDEDDGNFEPEGESHEEKGPKQSVKAAASKPTKPAVQNHKKPNETQENEDEEDYDDDDDDDYEDENDEGYQDQPNSDDD